jgi:hypothetical protein
VGQRCLCGLFYLCVTVPASCLLHGLWCRHLYKHTAHLALLMFLLTHDTFVAGVPHMSFTVLCHAWLFRIPPSTPFVWQECPTCLTVLCHGCRCVHS